MGRMVNYGRTPYLQYLLSICQSNMHLFTQFLKEKIEFSLMLIYIKFKTTANLLLAHDAKEK